MSQLIRRVAKKGFTLIELMIVVAIIGILAAIAIPKFADLIIKSKESSAKGSLGSVRGAVTIYYSDFEGTWPNAGAAGSLDDLLMLSGKYLDKIPMLSIPKHTTGAGNIGHGPVNGVVAATGDTGDWCYYRATGGVSISCSHVDTKGSLWNFW